MIKTIILFAMGDLINPEVTFTSEKNKNNPIATEITASKKLKKSLSHYVTCRLQLSAVLLHKSFLFEFRLKK